MPAPFFAGLVGGVGQALDQTRAMNFTREQSQREWERKVFTELAQSSDPQVQAAAITGMLTPAPRSSGMQGFVGIPQPHPAIAQLTRLINTPVEHMGTGSVSNPPELGFKQDVPTGTLPAGASAAQSIVPPGEAPGPKTDLTENVVGSAPPTDLSLGQVTNMMGQKPPTSVQVEAHTMGPRDLGLRASQIAGATAEAQHAGQFSGTIRGIREAGLAGPTGQVDTDNPIVAHALGLPISGEIQTYNVNGTPVSVSYHRGTNSFTDLSGNPIVMPTSAVRMTTGSVSPKFQVLAAADGRPHLMRIDPTSMQPVQDLGPKPVRDQYVQYSDGTNVWSVSVPAAFERPGSIVEGAPGPGSHAYDQRNDLSVGGAQLGTVPPTSGMTSSSGMAPSPANSVPPRSPTPSGGSVEPPAPPITIQPNGQVLISRGAQPGSWTVTKGTTVDASGSVHEVPVLSNPKLPGTFLDPRTKQPMGTDFVPGGLAAGASTLLQTTAQSISLMDAAMAKYEELGLVKRMPDGTVTGDDDPQTTINLSHQYFFGRGGRTQLDQMFGNIMQTEKLINVVSVTPYLHGSRALAWMTSIQGHLPVIPTSSKESWVLNITGTPGTGKYDPRGAVEPVVDSPLNAYLKLQGAKANALKMREAVLDEQGRLQLSKTVIGTGPPGGGGATGYQHDAKGNIYKDGQLVSPAVQ